MNTIVLKPLGKINETYYSSGQFFKNTSAGLYLLAHIGVQEITLLSLRGNDVNRYKDTPITKNQKTRFAFTLTELNTHYGLDLIPIDVTITEN